MEKAKRYLNDRDRVGSCALASAVLEEGLRHVLKIKPTEKKVLSDLIDSLEKLDAYNHDFCSKLRRCVELRNDAVHGRFGVLSKENAEFLVGTVDEFVITHNTILTAESKKEKKRMPELKTKKEVIATVESEYGEKVINTMLIFELKRIGIAFQRTWLVFTENRMVCHAHSVTDYLQKIRWDVPVSDFGSVNMRVSPDREVIFFSSSCGRWYYSPRLHPDPDKLKSEIERNMEAVRGRKGSLKSKEEVIAAVKEKYGEKIIGTILLFEPRRKGMAVQRTWLVFTENRMVCYAHTVTDNLEKIRWEIPVSDFDSVNIREDPASEVVSCSSSCGWWYYSPRLYSYPNDIKSRIEENMEKIKKIHLPKTLLTIDRTIYDPTTRDFIISTQRPLPNVKNWIEKNDPGMYWLVICVNNNTDRPIDEWGIEIETPSTLRILGAGIEDVEQGFHLTASSPKPWLTNWILGIPHHLGIVIPRDGSKRIYFKLASDTCGTSYLIAGKVSTAEYELPLEEKRFGFSCDQATLKTAMTTDPEAAERYAQTILMSRHSKEVALGLLHSFGILLDLYRCCTLRNYDDLSEKMLLLVGALEGAEAGQRIIDRVRGDYEIVRRLTPGPDSNTRVMGLCDSLVDMWINEVLKS